MKPLVDTISSPNGTGPINPMSACAESHESPAGFNAQVLLHGSTNMVHGRSDKADGRCFIIITSLCRWAGECGRRNHGIPLLFVMRTMPYCGLFSDGHGWANLHRRQNAERSPGCGGDWCKFPRKALAVGLVYGRYVHGPFFQCFSVACCGQDGAAPDIRSLQRALAWCFSVLCKHCAFW